MHVRSWGLYYISLIFTEKYSGAWGQSPQYYWTNIDKYKTAPWKVVGVNLKKPFRGSGAEPQ